MLEYRFAAGRADRLPALAAELVSLKFDAIVTESNAAAVAAKQATRTIPVVMAIAGDPLKAGVVNNPARPGGNVTGLTLMHPELSGKRLQILAEAVPSIGIIAVLWKQTSPAGADLLRETEAAARSLILSVHAIATRSPAVAARANALLLIPDAIFDYNRTRLVEFTMTKQRLTGLACHSSDTGGGVSVTRYWKAGTVDYKRIPELAGVDLDRLRGTQREEVRVSLTSVRSG